MLVCVWREDVCGCVYGGRTCVGVYGGKMCVGVCTEGVGAVNICVHRG